MREEGGDNDGATGAWLLVAAGGCAHGAFVGSMAGQARQAIAKDRFASVTSYMSMFAAIDKFHVLVHVLTHVDQSSVMSQKVFLEILQKILRAVLEGA